MLSSLEMSFLWFSPVLFVLTGLCLKILYCGFSGTTGGSKRKCLCIILGVYLEVLLPVLSRSDGPGKRHVFQSCGRMVPGPCLQSPSWKWLEVTWLGSLFLGGTSEGRWNSSCHLGRCSCIYISGICSEQNSGKSSCKIHRNAGKSIINTLLKMHIHCCMYKK